MVNVFSLRLSLQSVQETLTSMELLVFVMMDFMKFQDTTVKDVPMEKFGMGWNVITTHHVHQDMFTTLIKINVILKPSIVDKILFGMELYVFAMQVIIYWMEIALNVLPIQLGMEKAVIPKFLSIVVDRIKFLSMGNVCVKMVSIISKEYAFNVLQEQVGMEGIVTVRHQVTGVWVSQIPKL